MLFTEGPEGHNIDLLTHYHDPIRYLHIVIMAVCHVLLFWVYSRCTIYSYFTFPKPTV